MYLWVLMVAWGVVSPLSALIDWRSRTDYERARGVSRRCAARSSGSGDRRQIEGLLMMRYSIFSVPNLTATQRDHLGLTGHAKDMNGV